MPLTSKLDALCALLPDVIVAGISTVKRANMHSESKGGVPKIRLIVEGTDLARVMTTPGVRTSSTKSNSVMEVATVLGVEAARQTLINELRYVMDQHHIDISLRHLRLIADYMTWTGEVLGINRFGMGKVISLVRRFLANSSSFPHHFDLVSLISTAVLLRPSPRSSSL